ncbi:MAG TPA: hypothetical protein VEJ86_10930, partial [Candidatus Binataceae bacterium]|nr:hypothetical protein [Candidatus Binataceae bacterium]
MRTSLVGTAVIVAVLQCGSAWGFSWTGQAASEIPDATKTVKMVNYNATFKLISDGSPASGACSLNTYSSICPSGDCMCATFTGSGSGNTFGKCTSLVMAVTFDVALGFANASPIMGQPDGVCYPAFGAIEITGSKENETIDINGSVCNEFNGSAPLGGGFGFDASTANY